MNKILFFLAFNLILFCSQVLAQTPTITAEDKQLAQEIVKDWGIAQPRMISGIVNGRATNLIKPECPKDKNASGIVKVFVWIDGNGKVKQAESISGDYWLLSSAEEAVKMSNFLPNYPVDIFGFIIYKLNCKTNQQSKPVFPKGNINSNIQTFVQAIIPPNAHYGGAKQNIVRLRVLIDSEGNVLEAKALSGPPQARPSAVAATRVTRFNIPLVDEKPELVYGIYKFEFPKGNCGRKDSQLPDGQTLNNKAIKLPAFKFPSKSEKPTQLDAFKVLVKINEKGNVDEATMFGPGYLKELAEKWAKQAKFEPFYDAECRPKKLSGYLEYNPEPNPDCVIGGIGNDKAIFLPKPETPENYVQTASDSGYVKVNIIIDENGNVSKAVACSGHPILRKNAVKAALKARFQQTKLSGVPVKVNRTIIYQFTVPNPKPKFDCFPGGGVVNSKANFIPFPKISSYYKNSDLPSGAVNVRVKINEKGDVTDAAVCSGHPLLRRIALESALRAKFIPTILSGVPVEVFGVIVYQYKSGQEFVEVPLGDKSTDKLNEILLEMPTPLMPKLPAKLKVDNKVVVQVLIDENGKPIEAQAVTNHLLLRKIAEQTALQAKFQPTIQNGQKVKNGGLLTVIFRQNKKCVPNPTFRQGPQVPTILNGNAIYLPKPEYPQNSENAEGAVNIQVVIDENGNVVSATAVSGHQLLRESAEKAVRKAKFEPFLDKNCNPIQISGIVVYQFKKPEVTPD